MQERTGSRTRPPRFLQQAAISFEAMMHLGSLSYEAPDCAQCRAREDSVFSNLGSPELVVLSTSKRCRCYKRGELIFAVNDRPSGIHCIQTGRVKLYKMSRDGREQIVRLAGAGDILGYRSLIADEPYSLYARPLEESRICHIPRSTFISLLSTDRTLSLNVMMLLAADVRSAEEKMIELAQRSVTERVAETLLLLRETYGVEADQQTIDARLTRADIASMVGSVVETVSRSLTKLKQDGSIGLVGRRIMILDAAALTRAAQLQD
jgi:CRP/FNR family transcriptional regulator